MNDKHVMPDYAKKIKTILVVQDVKIYYQGLGPHPPLDEEPRREQVELGCTHTFPTAFQVVYTKLNSSPSSPQHT
jgi:hypothetical protein